MNKKIRKIVSVILMMVMVLSSLTGCGSEETATETPTKNADEKTVSFNKDDTWAVYWYLCGSDLESEGGAATDDLNEMLEVTLPSNVKVVIEAGGTKQWQNDLMDSKQCARYEYNSEGLSLVEENKLENMGESKTFENFLNFCKTNYEADHKILLFWNHGGGSVTGAESDENFDGDALTLAEMQTALNNVYSDSKPFELVGFDTCLMATLETATVYKDYSRYLVASEETEPGNGWLYSGWLGSLAENTAQDGAQLGTAICDTFKEGCKAVGTQDEITLSVTDLSKIDALNTSFQSLGKEVLQAAYQSSSVCGDFARSANKAEKYGPNSNSEGYTNMVDLGDLVSNAAELSPNSAASVQDALKAAVVYKIDSKYRKKSNGLSVYYSFDCDKDSLKEYEQFCPSKEYSYFLNYSLGEQIPSDAGEVSGLGSVAAEPIQSFSEDIPVSINDEGYAQFDLDPQALDNVSKVTTNLTYFDNKEDIYINLGYDNDITADYENGHFEDNFRGVWCGLDGHLAYLELSYSDEEYNLYDVPIMLNGKQCSMCVAYSFEDKAYYILGASKGLNSAGMADKNLIEIKKGDTVAMILYAGTISGDGESEPVEMESFKIKNNSQFNEMDIDEGTYSLFFQVEDTTGNVTYSDAVALTYKDGNIDAEVAK